MNTFIPQLDSASSLPPFRQLHDAVIAAIAAGSLVPGARLPTVRSLASELGLATNTVASAYRSLEAAGIVEGRGRAGTFVSMGDDPIESRARLILQSATRELREVGVDRTRALRLLGDAYDA